MGFFLIEIWCIFGLLALCFYIKKLCNTTASVIHGEATLPPGSIGWPYIGETLQLYSQDPNVFFSSKQKRYGEVFKSHILGYPCIMLASPEAARFVLLTQVHLFRPTYPRSKERLIGPSAIFFHQGDYHARLRKLIRGSLALDKLKYLVADISAIAVSISQSWVDGKAVNTFQEMKKFSFEVGILAIFGQLGDSFKEELRRSYNVVEKGYNSFPVNLPGTRYRKALKARDKLSKILTQILAQRKESSVAEKNVLGFLQQSRDENGEALRDEQIVDNILGVLFAAQDTTASALTWIIKYLLDKPKVLSDVKNEHLNIRRLNNERKRPLQWSQTRSMPLTYKVVMESLRMASIISFAFREAVVDVEYNGYRIPKGWKVMPLFRNIHHNPELFEDPQTFDPSRFVVPPKPNTLMPFGVGAHACPGNELAKLEIHLMIHHLITNFRWEAEGNQMGIQYSPFPVPSQGLPARFWRERT